MKLSEILKSFDKTCLISNESFKLMYFGSLDIGSAEKFNWYVGHSISKKKNGYSSKTVS